MNIKIHFRDIRLFNNAGMSFPHCKANARLLDTDKGRLPTTPSVLKVTCKACLKRLKVEISKS